MYYIKRQIILFIIFVVIAFVGVYKDDFNKNNEEEYYEEYVNVYLEGEATLTGMFEVPVSWTLKDLVELIGVTEDADLSKINLGEKMENNKIYNIPKKTISDSKKININTASKEELMTLPQIGEAIALRIIEYRGNTLFQNIEEIKNVSGIGDKLYEKIRDLITI